LDVSFIVVASPFGGGIFHELKGQHIFLLKPNGNYRHHLVKH